MKKLERYSELNPCKNVFDNTEHDFTQSMSIDQILESLEITKFEFEQALSISEDDSFQIHLKKELN